MRLLFYFAKWYFIEVPLEILKGGKNFIRFGFYYFSTSRLLKSLFSPWRRYKWKYGSFDFKKYLNVFASNIISRTLGALMRIFLIFISLLYEIIVISVFSFVLILWLLLPFICLTSFLLGLVLIV